VGGCASRWAKAMSKDCQLLIGIDGGGTRTTAAVAALHSDGSIEILGTGAGGPSNMRAVGAVHAKTNLDIAVDAAHEAAGTASASIDCAVLGLAGSSLPDVQSVITDWAARRKLAAVVDIVHDAELVLTVGMRDGCGVGLVVGTGSVAIGCSPSGERAVVGGWGYWFGDQGSGFDLGRRALTAVANAMDGIGPETSLSAGIVERMHVQHPREISRQLSLAVDVRRDIAALAPLVIHAAVEGDEVAVGIVDAGVAAVADIVVATVRKLQLGNTAPLAMAGGVAGSGAYFRDKLLARLRAAGVEPDPVTLVVNPFNGALIMARNRLLASA
jgi:N-acetylglucosamine kinase-like BadF-type ATPase